MNFDPNAVAQVVVLLGVWVDLRSRITRIEDRCFKRLCIAGADETKED